MRILITRTDRIGDVVLSTPIIKAVRQAYPDAYIGFMVEKAASDIVKGNPYLNEVLVYDKKGANKGLAGFLSFLFKLMKKRFDAAIILHPAARAHLTCYLAGIPKRVGYDKKLGFLLTQRIAHKKQEGLKHEVEYNFDLLRALDIKFESKELIVPLSEAIREEAGRILKEAGVDLKAPLAALHAGASCPSKRWPAAKFAELIDALNRRHELQIVLLGGQETMDISKDIVKKAKSKIIDLTGKTSVAVLAGILSKCRLFISNDSGPVHISSAVETPVISIFGRNEAGLSPKRWGPLGKRDIIVHKDVGCEVCLAHRCDKGFKCLEAITVGDVLGAVERIFDVGKQA